MTITAAVACCSSWGAAGGCSKYLAKKDITRYRALIERLGLRRYEAPVSRAGSIPPGVRHNCIDEKERHPAARFRAMGRSSVVVFGSAPSRTDPRASIEDRPLAQAGDARYGVLGGIRPGRAPRGEPREEAPPAGIASQNGNGRAGFTARRSHPWRVCIAPRPLSTTVRSAFISSGSRRASWPAWRPDRPSSYLDDETMVLSATTAGKQPREGYDFFPLTVDVEERMYAVGRIPGSFFRREGRPSEDAILTCRLIDRPLRPSFVKGLRNEVQVVETIMALNPDHLYDVVAINAASLSTQISGLPFSGPIGGVRVALIKGQWVGFPTHSAARGGHLRHGGRGPRHRERRRRDHDGRGGVHAEHAGPARHRGQRRRRADRGDRRPGPGGGQAVHQGRCARRSSRSPSRRPSRPRSSRSSWTTPRTSTRRSPASSPTSWPRC